MRITVVAIVQFFCFYKQNCLFFLFVKKIKC